VQKQTTNSKIAATTKKCNKRINNNKLKKEDATIGSKGAKNTESATEDSKTSAKGTTIAKGAKKEGKVHLQERCNKKIFSRLTNLFHQVYVQIKR